MPKYISLLRGINVSGQKKIKMAELRELCSTLGYKNVITYIQTGNLIFDLESTNPSEISDEISKAIKQAYKFEVQAITKTAQEFSAIYNNNPLLTNLNQPEPSKLYLTFLKNEPKNSDEIDFKKWQSKNEKLVIKAKQIYLYYPEGYGKSKLTNNIFERELAVVATTRNWRTVGKLVELSQK